MSSSSTPRRRSGPLAALLVVIAVAWSGTPVAAATATAEVSWVVVRDGRPSVSTTRVADGAAAALVARLRARPDVVAADVARPVQAQAEDPLRALQWGLDRIDAPAGWALSRPAVDQIVAVVDTGVDGTHQDLAGIVLPGWDALGPGDGRIDPNGHGTHVAGIAAAITDNGLDVAGTTPGLRILPVRVLDATGEGSSADVADGIYWAVEHGATIVNLSLGSDGPDEVLAAAVRHAVASGVVVVAAAGNRSSSEPVWPAAMPEVIGVTAIDEAGQRPGYASHGRWVDLAAPGDEIMSTYTANTATYLSGTSMAAPFVSAVAAELLTIEPGLTPARVRARLIYNSVDIVAPGRDDEVGWGLLSAARTLAPTAAFTDVTDGVHATAVHDLAGTRITAGCAADRFCPGRPIHRDQLATFLVRALRLPLGPPAGFVDTAGNRHERAIDALAAAGITTGCTPERFCPDGTVSRAEAATFIARALELAASGPSGFVDVPPASTHAAGIASVAEAGITVGCAPQRFCPAQRLTRAQMASLLARAFFDFRPVP